MKKTTSQPDTMEKLIALLKRRGFVFQGSEIYGGLAGTWDYGPLGVRLKHNIKNLWWKRFVSDRDDMYGMDAAILMNQNVWKASGHVGGFSDPLVECLECKRRFRVDQIVDDGDYKKFIFQITSHIKNSLKGAKEEIEQAKDLLAYSKSKKELSGSLDKSIEEMINSVDKTHDTSSFLINERNNALKYLGVLTQGYLNLKLPCPNCGNKQKWGVPRQFNMMFQTHVGASEDATSVSYLRPETAQGMFVNFKNLVDTMHPKLPFGMAQIGKAFRNEIAPRDFLFRVREFEQMEIEYFVHPDAWQDAFEEFVAQIHLFTRDIGLPTDRVHELEIAPADLAHYSKRTIDFEFDFPFGKKELYGLAYRTDFDLKAHASASGVDLSYFDEDAKVRIVPHCIEPSFGVDRSVLAVLTSAYSEDELGGERREYLKLAPQVAPIKVAVFPLLKNKEALTAKAQELYHVLRKEFGAVEYDAAGSIGKRYRKHDEIGTPFCITIDFDTIEKEDNPVTVRDRDTGQQEPVKLDNLVSYLSQKLGN